MMDLHSLYLLDGVPHLVSEDGLIHWKATPFSYALKPIQPVKPDVEFETKNFVGKVRVEENRMICKGNFSSVAQTLYFEFHEGKFGTFLHMMKELIPESFVSDESELIFLDGSRLSLKHLPFFLNQFDGPYVWLLLFKAQKEGFASITDGKTQLTHIDQLQSPMKEQIKELTDFIELFELTGHEFNGVTYSFERPKLSI
ncbi:MULTISPECIES: hypothetical protein [Vibrio]|nr:MULTISPECIES: hypothetical protein [Vibrio]RTZ24605.1 hypothetical protein EKN09_02805 [Vibrio penaeicida]